jgi:hypothetical protein
MNENLLLPAILRERLMNWLADDRTVGPTGELLQIVGQLAVLPTIITEGGEDDAAATATPTRDPAGRHKDQHEDQPSPDDEDEPEPE